MSNGLKKQPGRHEGRSALELIDEAVHLLRWASLGAWASYYTGSLPFVLGLLYFWADMSRSALAEERCAPAALGVGLLFLWMKGWQALFARQLKAQMAGEPAPHLNFHGLAQVAALQTILQPSGLLLLPLALIVTLPFGWVYAFFQNATALGGDAPVELKELFKRALRQAELWPGQNHLVLLLLCGFGLFVFLNVALGAIAVPGLIRTLLGLELAFGKSWSSVFNTTFLATVCGVTYLCLDPLIKAVYVLRCFYGESLHSGEDLKAGLKAYLAKGRIGAAARIMLLVGSTTTSFSAIDPKAAQSAETQSVSPGARAGVSSAELDRSISHVIHQREYSWRLPRQSQTSGASRPRGVLGRFADGIAATLKSWASRAGTYLEDLLEWLAKKLSRWLGGRRGVERSGADWLSLSRWLLFALLAVAASVLAIACLRWWRKRRQTPVEAEARAVAAIPDLADENILANQWPEEDWLELARNLAEQGDLRNALRALFLASLAHLARREMITLARFKSNHEYERELRRRARTSPDLQTAFAQNVTIYDRVWYGLHEVNQQLADQFTSNLEKIKAG